MSQPASDLRSAFLRAAARAELRVRGMSLREAARATRVNFSHISRVLSGQRESTALLTRILSLPPRL